MTDRKPPTMPELISFLEKMEAIAQDLEANDRHDIADIIRLNTFAAHFKEVKRIEREIKAAAKARKDGATDKKSQT